MLQQLVNWFLEVTGGILTFGHKLFILLKKVFGWTWKATRKIGTMQFWILERAGRAYQLLPKGIWRKYYMMRHAGFFDTLFHLVSPDWCTLGASVLPCPTAHGTRLAWALFIQRTSVDNFRIFKASVGCHKIFLQIDLGLLLYACWDIWKVTGHKIWMLSA